MKNIIILIIICCSFPFCQIKQEDKKAFESIVVYEEDRDRYQLTKIRKEFFGEDTVWYYRDSLLNDLAYFQTYVKKKGELKINQSIKIIDGTEIDENNSYLYTLNRTAEKLVIDVKSIYKDSIYLIIGEIDSNYTNYGRVDSFNIENNNLKIKFKDYYERGRLGVLNKVDTNTFHGKEMYIPFKHLNPD